SGSDTDKGLIIVRGKFDVAKFEKKAAQVAEDMKDVIKIHKVPDGLGGNMKLYEVKIPNQDQPMFVAITKTALLASPGKDYVLDAVEKTSGRKETKLKHKDLQAMLNRVDPKQSIWVAVLGSALEKSELAKRDETKEIVEKVQDVSGGITVDKNIKIELDVT